MAALEQAPTVPLRLNIAPTVAECPALALAAPTPRGHAEPTACSLSASMDLDNVSAHDGGAATLVAEATQPATATSAPAAAPITLIGRQRPRKHASPAASSPTASCAAKACFREGAAAPLLRRRCVLVAKQLTNSDASSGRIILPRVAVESNLSFVLGYRHYALAVRDSEGRRYEFMIKSWANGTEHRRVFVLEQAGEFLRSHGMGVGDAVGICSDENGELVVEANTEEVRQATVSPKYGSLALAAPPPGSTAAVPLVAGAAGRCIRSPHCTKAAGHPGFCSGPKAAAAAAAKQHRAAAHHASHGHTHAHHHHAAAATSDASARGAAAGSGSSGEEAATRLGTPRSGRSAGVAAAEWAAAAAAAAAKLPEGLHEVAHVPTGLRLAKVLTGYDLSSRRVVMPVPAVEAGFATAPSVDLLTLAAVDESERWHFPTLHAWTNVAGRRGYLLDGLAGWLAARGAAEGDALVVFRNSEAAPPRLEVQASGTCEVRRSSEPDASAPTFESIPLLLHAPGRGPATAAEAAAAAAAAAHGRGLVLLSARRGGAATCRRTTTCTKPAGHQGFCSGHKGFKRRESPTSSVAMGARRAFARRHEDSDWMSEDEAYLTASDDDSSPTFSVRSRSAKRPRRAAAAVAVAVAAAAASRDGSPSPPPASDPLLSLLSALNSADEPAATAGAGAGGAAAAAVEAALTAEAAAHAAYDAAKQLTAAF
ncbi:B3 domain-containing transcription factor LEC2 isoform B [Micractinium conductrix]|uniref:B3 domain-containing transcription factor LEC2 isoform A n=1 Tax=Micractinium conductrix TaxID=554055 RepID=A0A2P6V8V1_9CHLO|nr:B3 domain-containing transcription factor LEC2 isoform A [Micractinium conductrix]PSC70512.1 B3 domain-containing transcription factor LEC2 isoform B [Micractinium conductrix]|eukprot:PSC70511.1 B3 domain-containing transcription factor LEC2 isoform A [Micractinium conductrix]